MKPIKPIFVIILLVVVGAGAFYGGMIYQKNQRPSFGAGGRGGFYRNFNGGAGGQRGAGGTGGGQAMTPVRGQIVSTGNNTITVKLPNGSSKIVDLTGQTRINKATTGSVSDLKQGITVTAIGTANSDGSVTADDVTIGNLGFRARTGNQSQQAGQ